MTKETFGNLLRNRKVHITLKRFKRIVMLFMLIPILIFNIVTTVLYSSKLSSELEQKHNIAYSAVVSDIERCFEEVGRAYRAIIRERTTERFLGNTDNSIDGVEYGELKWEVRKTLVFAKNDNENLSELSLYAMRDGKLMTESPNSDIDEWQKRYEQSGEVKQIFRKDNKIIFSHAVRMNGEITGVTFITITCDRIEAMLSLDDYSSDMAVVLRNNDSGEELFRCGDINAYKTRLYQTKNGQAEIEFAVGRKEYTNMVAMIVIYLLVCIVAGVLIAYVVSLLCAVYLYDSVTEVLANIGETEDESMTKVSKNVLFDIKNDEDIEKELAEALNHLHNTQLTALQMQINPHFVFNVLNFANVVILDENTTNVDASEILALLSDILGYAMDEPRYSAKVSEEIEMAKKYIEIERIKFVDEFDVVWKVAPEAYERECLKRFLQPIIENSITHGVKKLKNKRGIIEVSISCSGNDTIFVVKDNGDGLTKERLAELRERMKEPYLNYSKHIGLRNVNERIRLVYGENYGVSIDSGKNGTKVTVKIGGGSQNKPAEVES